MSVCISADGNTVAIGSSYDNLEQGAIWVFTRSGGVWSQQGNKLVGTGNVVAAWQGWSVAISADGNILIEGGLRDDSSGAAWIFTRNGNVWTQKGNKIKGTNSSVGSGFGSSLALSSDANTVIIGGSGDNNGLGAAWVFINSTTAVNNLTNPNPVVFKAYPNPLQNGNLQMSVSNVENGKYAVVLNNSLGQKVSEKTFYYWGSNTVVDMNIKKLASGIYFVSMLNQQGEKIAEQKIIK